MAKLLFYRHHGAREAVLVDPEASTVHWLARHGDDLVPVDDSAVLGIEVAGILADLLH